MKINFEITSAELAQFLAEFASLSAENRKKAEEMLIANFFTALQQEKDKDLIKKPEDMCHGIIH